MLNWLKKNLEHGDILSGRALQKPTLEETY